MPVAGGSGGVAGAQRVPGDPARVMPAVSGALLDGQRDGLGDEGDSEGLSNSVSGNEIIAT